MINIAGAFSHFAELYLYMLKHQIKSDVCVYDSLGNHPWNGGRVNYLYSKPFNYKQIDCWNCKNIGVFLTLSNRYIDFVKEPVEELEYLNKSSLNGIICGNHDLNEMIHKKYPNLKTMLSVTYFYDLNIPNLIPLEQSYDFICPRYEWVFDPNFYKQINDFNKYEILINDTCRYGCKLWGKHFDTINRANRDNISNSRTLHKIQECWLTGEYDAGNPDTGWLEDKLKYGDKLGMDLNQKQVQIAKNIGYKHWKISGRELTTVYIDEINNSLNALGVL